MAVRVRSQVVMTQNRVPLEERKAESSLLPSVKALSFSSASAMSESPQSPTECLNKAVEMSSLPSDAAAPLLTQTFPKGNRLLPNKKAGMVLELRRSFLVLRLPDRKDCDCGRTVSQDATLPQNIKKQRVSALPGTRNACSSSVQELITAWSGTSAALMQTLGAECGD